MVRRLRHWKQRFEKNAKFIFRRGMLYGATQYKPGDDIPQILQDNPAKLRRFWESGVIELAAFDEPDVMTGAITNDLPAGITVEQGKGSWFIITDGEETYKANGKKNLKALIERLKTERAKADEEKRLAEEAETSAAMALLGSSVLESSYEIGGKTVSLGDIVASAFAKAEVTAVDWNAADSEAIEELLAAELALMQAAAENLVSEDALKLSHKTGLLDPKVEDSENPEAKTDEGSNPGAADTASEDTEKDPINPETSPEDSTEVDGEKTAKTEK